MTKIFSSGTVNNRQSNKQIKPGVLLFSTNSPSKNLRFFAEIFVEFFVAINKTKRFFIFTFSPLKSEREFSWLIAIQLLWSAKHEGNPLWEILKNTGQIKTLENTQPDSAFKYSRPSRSFLVFYSDRGLWQHHLIYIIITFKL